MIINHHFRVDFKAHNFYSLITNKRFLPPVICFPTRNFLFLTIFGQALNSIWSLLEGLSRQFFMEGSAGTSAGLGDNMTWSNAYHNNIRSIAIKMISVALQSQWYQKHCNCDDIKNIAIAVISAALWWYEKCCDCNDIRRIPMISALHISEAPLYLLEKHRNNMT